MADNTSKHPLPTEAPLYGDRKRVAIVTGAASGIGLAIALRLAKDGFDVAINDINQRPLESVAEQIKALGARTSAIVGDVSKSEDVENIIDKAVSDLGHLDVMIANAGIAEAKTFLDSTEDDLDRALSINTRGVFLCYKYAAKQFIKQGTGGKLISATSLAGLQYLPLVSMHTASKFAVRGINQAAAAELAPYGITANCYAPGAVFTSLVERYFSSVKEINGVSREETINKFETNTPVGRLGIPEDTSNVVSFLASRNSDYITGQTIQVDGGARMS